MKEAVRQVSGEDCEIVGASRTDSGAHAEGQVCHFDTGAQIPPERWARALNRVLPSDLRVMDSKRVSEKFNSRFCALDREYRYAIYSGKQNPRRDRFAHYEHRPLIMKAMREAAKKLVGKHDYRAFTEELAPEVENTVRRMHKVSVWKSGEIWNIDIQGTAFLRGMMRRMSGAILEAGLGRRNPQEIEALLDPKKRNDLTWPVVLPAKGLTLIKIRYGPHPKDNRNRSENEEP